MKFHIMAIFEGDIEADTLEEAKEMFAESEHLMVDVNALCAVRISEQEI